MSKETPRKDSSRSSSVTPRFISPYAFTKTGVAGEQRESMLYSELQTLSELGKAHQRGHKIPPASFTYGIALPRHDRGVAEALCYTPEKERAANPDFEFVRDYAALNRAAVDAGMITARDQARYRTVHDIKRKVFIRDVSLAKTVRKFPEDMIFGIPHRPSTPIEDVLRNSFGDKWVESMAGRQANQKKSQADVTHAFKGSYHTKTSLLRQAKIPVESKPLWKLPKFADGEHQIDTFRSEDDRRNAFSALTFDTIPRQGTNHTGIYNVLRTTVKT